MEEERVNSFLRSLYPDEEGIVATIEQAALEDQVPIVRKETRQWLKMILLLKKPIRVLEVGTAVGFSAIYMCQFLPEQAHITTIENWEPRILAAKDNFSKAGVADRITLLEGDAADWLSRLTDSYDFIFMDAAKGQYIHFLPDVVRLLSKGGILVSDNILQDGEVLDSKYVVERRNRTIHGRMREYLYALTHHEELETSVIPIGDGVAMSIKKE